jgi:hypothetical protein
MTFEYIDVGGQLMVSLSTHERPLAPFDAAWRASLRTGFDGLEVGTTPYGGSM